MKMISSGQVGRAAVKTKRKYEMKKLMVTTLAAVTAVAVNAQEFGSATAEAEKALPPPTGEGAGVEQVQQVMNEEVEPAQTAIEAIEEYFNSKDNWNKGYDEENDRIIVSDFIEFQIKNPKVSTDFVNLRKEKLSELMLKAKSKIIEQIMSKMSGSRILDVPGNPIAKQLEKEQKEMRKQLLAAQEELAKLDKNLADALAARDGVTASELVAVISSWFTKAEQENLAAKMDTDKKERYANAKAEFEEAEKAYKDLAEKAEALKGTISKTMKTSLSRVSEMPIYGCTILQQAESITEKNGKYTYQIAILYSWSGEMQRASGEILKGESVKFKPGKKSIKQWIAGKVKNGALSQWCGPRQYIDDKGNMWFIGISCAPLGDDADDNETARESAELEAAAEVMFALYSDASSSKTLNKLMQTKVGAGGEKETKVYQDYSKTQQESFKDIQIAGNSELFNGKLRHGPSGLDFQVVVYGVNSGNVKALKDIQTRAVALGIEVNTYQEMERGRQQQLKKTFEASKNNAAARAAGASKANADIAAEAAKAKARRAARQQNTGFKEVKGQQSASPATGKLKTGTAIITDDDE